MDISRYDDFRASVRSGFSARTQQAVDEALAWAAERLGGELRYDGSPMLDHAVAVASIVISEVGLGRNSAVASILHDVVRLAHKRLSAAEFLALTDEIRARFGEEVVGITVSKFTEADNMGFGIPVATLRKLLDTVGEPDRTQYGVLCPGCDTLIRDEDEYCPSCGEKLPDGVFDVRTQTPLGAFVESAIERMGIAPVLARNGSDSWLFHKGSSEIRIFVYDGDYLFSTSPINLLPKKNVEPVLDYMLSEDFGPYKLGIEGRQIYIAYRIHLSDITPESEDTIRDRIVGLALRADEMDNMLIERFGCEFSEYSKAEA